MKNIIVFLNGTRGLQVVEELKKSSHEILKCVIPIEKKFNAVQKLIKKIGFECLRIENVNDKDIILNLKKLNPELFIIAGYSTIFKKDLVNLPKKGTINLHAGRLPEYRGGSPLNWQIINGEKIAVISVIKADEQIDTGVILKESEIKIEETMDINDLHNQANKVFPRLVKDLLDSIDKKEKLNNRIQNNKNASYWHQRNDNDGYLNFSKVDAKYACRFVRALTFPYPGAWAMLNQNKVRIFKIEIPKFKLCGAPGRICYVQNKGPYVICKDRAVLIQEYKIEKKNKTLLKQGDYLT